MKAGIGVRMASAAALLLLAGAAAAQLAALKQTSPQRRATVLTDVMKRRLNLSPDQVTKVAAINLEYANKVQPVLEGADRPLEELREMKQIDEQKDAALKTVLTPAQVQEYQAAKAEIRQKFEQRLMQGGSAGGTTP